MHITTTVFRRYTIAIRLTKQAWGSRELKVVAARTYPAIPVPGTDNWEIRA